MKTQLTFLTCMLSLGCISQAQAKHLLVSEKAMATNNVSVSETINNSNAAQKEKAAKPAAVKAEAASKVKNKVSATTMNPYLSISFTPEAAMTNLYFYGHKQAPNTSHT
ncbi:hypothetical protein [Edaphocola aurantiacus]|uniref:hypothetical protein n=1 Tax=Edaphocola aurantiacus TaxID=2601682 RepID=UPI001C93D184|nr:hypothetical protein [Edaphocola aurantiacus]